MQKPNRTRREILTLAGTVTVAGIGVLSAGNAVAGETETAPETEAKRTLEWTGHGDEHAVQDCEPTERGFWHWVLTPGGSTPLLEPGTELTVHFADGSTRTAEGTRRSAGGGALHFEMTKESDGTVTAAEVTFSGGGDNPVLTISDARCEPNPDNPPEAFEDLVVTDECVNGKGTITVSNSNDVVASVTVSGPNGYEETTDVSPDGMAEFPDLENGTYSLETMSGEIGFDRETVEIDY